MRQAFAFLFLFIGLVSVGTLNAQVDPRDAEFPAEDLSEIADNFFVSGQFFESQEYYLAADAKDSTVPHYAYQIGISSQKLKDYSLAATYFKKYLDRGFNEHQFIYFDYATALKMSGQTKEAIKQFKNFKNKYKGANQTIWFDRASDEIEGCELYLEWQDKFPAAELYHADNGVNMASVEYAARPYLRDQMVYAAIKSDTVRYENTDKELRSKMYFSEFDGESWAVSTELTELTHKKHHVGNPYMAEDQSRFYFTRCKINKKTGENCCKIYVSQYGGGLWRKAKKVKGINKRKSTNTQPTLGRGPNGQEVLWFVSDRKDGFGGLDIYYAQRSAAGKFEFPVNAGADINTRGDDITPYYDSEKETLYWSTENKPGFGGFDIFSAQGNIDGWDEATNVGFPLNSIADDTYYNLSPDGETGYLVSNREGGVAQEGFPQYDDIYSFKLLNEEDQKIVLKAIVAVKGDENNKPLEGVDVGIYEVDGKNFLFVESLITQKNQPFIVELQQGTEFKVNANLENFLPTATTFIAPTPGKKDTIEKVFYLEEIKRKKVKVKNVYFAFDKANVTNESQGFMDTMLMELNADTMAVVNIKGHTDSKGPFWYNDKLSVKRAQEAAKYLVMQGIGEDQISLEGFGEYKPIAPNVNPDGSDNPVGRATNRRVNFKVVPSDDLEVIYENNKPTVIDDVPEIDEQ